MLSLAGVSDHTMRAVVFERPGAMRLSEMFVLCGELAAERGAGGAREVWAWPFRGLRGGRSLQFGAGAGSK